MEATKVVTETTVNIVAEAALKELGGLSKLVVIEPDKGKSKTHNKSTYTSFKKVIKVENYKASNLEAL